MTYEEYREKRQKEINTLPLVFAFSNEQLDKALKKRGYTLKDAGKVLYALPGQPGTFYFKNDAETIREYFNHDTDGELRKMMEDDKEFCREAFEYEMWNHEYPINWEGDYDVCSCFGHVEFDECKEAFDYLTELGFTAGVIKIYLDAASHVRRTGEW